MKSCRIVMEGKRMECIHDLLIIQKFIAIGILIARWGSGIKDEPIAVMLSRDKVRLTDLESLNSCAPRASISLLLTTPT